MLLVIQSRVYLSLVEGSSFLILKIIIIVIQRFPYYCYSKSVQFLKAPFTNKHLLSYQEIQQQYDTF